MTKLSTNQLTPTHKATKLLAESVSQLMNSDTYKAALQFRRKFHAYSFRNVWLIYTQFPTATYVAGYHRWLQLGRHVKKGESGISILAPMTRKSKDEEGNDNTFIFGFKSATVFDYSQTEGQELPELPAPQLLVHDSETIQETFIALESYAKTQGITIIKTSDLGPALGSYTYANQHIKLREDLPPMQMTKTLIHELAHARLHGLTARTADAQETKPRHVKELEAESCAFLVCEAMGLDSSSYSFPYLASWADDPAEILPAAEVACRAADELLEVIHNTFVNLPMAA